jgi:hypothetical protein
VEQKEKEKIVKNTRLREHDQDALYRRREPFGDLGDSPNGVGALVSATLPNKGRLSVPLIPPIGSEFFTGIIEVSLALLWAAAFFFTFLFTSLSLIGLA